MDEWKARKFIFLSYIIILIIMFALIVYIAILKEKINDNKCPECEKCTVVETNDDKTNNNTNNNDKENENNTTIPEEKESITLGKDLWKKAYDFYWNFVNNIQVTNVSVGVNKINNYNSFDFSIFTSGAKEELNKYFEIKNINGDYIIEKIRLQKDSTYLKSETFTIINENTTKITFNVTSKYCTNNSVSNCKDIAKVENEFVIFNDNNIWKIYSFVLPD